jgi:very-short-patch-repair endonuclease/predicted transcriptional regulator of viral defense system
MGSQNLPSRSARLWSLAKRDHDIVSRRELLDLGYHAKAIQHRVQIGKLHRKARGVYAVGSPHITHCGRLMVAVKRCGPGTVLSHLSAAVLWGIWKRPPAGIHVTVPRRASPKPEGVHVHRRDLRVGATTLRDHIPVTTPLQTLIDCAPNRARREVERLINQADAQNLLRADVLRGELEGRTEPGAVILREILDQDAFVLTDSELERLFVPIALRAGLPKPLTQQWVCGYRVDFYWPELELVVEVDGLRYHRTAIQQRRDLERAHALEGAGLTCRRLTYWQVAKEPVYVGGVLARVRPPAQTPGRPRAA